MSETYSRCEFCQSWCPASGLLEDPDTSLRCWACADGVCARCHERETQPNANLCEGCVRRLGLTSLRGLVGSGIEVETYDLEYPVGILRGVSIRDGDPHLILGRPEMECRESGVGWFWSPSWIAVVEAMHIELCLPLPEGWVSDPQMADWQRVLAWFESRDAAEQEHAAERAPTQEVAGDPSEIIWLDGAIEDAQLEQGE